MQAETWNKEDKRKRQAREQCVSLMHVLVNPSLRWVEEPEMPGWVNQKIGAGQTAEDQPIGSGGEVDS